MKKHKLHVNQLVTSLTLKCHTSIDFNCRRLPPYSSVTLMHPGKLARRTFAWIFYDQSLMKLDHKTISLRHVSSPVMAEALAIRGALLYAASFNITNISLQSDSQELIRGSGQSNFTEFYPTSTLLPFSSFSIFTFCCFDFFSRSVNVSTDLLESQFFLYYLTIFGF